MVTFPPGHWRGARFTARGEKQAAVSSSWSRLRPSLLQKDNSSRGALLTYAAFHPQQV